MKIFLSWSGNAAKQIAENLKEELKTIFENSGNIDIFVSSQDITAGAEWFSEISSAIDESVCGIVCLTKENTNSEEVSDWINFEAGALAFHLKDKKKALIPVLFGVKLPEKSPLRVFEHIKWDKSLYIKLIQDINEQYLKTDLKNKQIRDLASASFDRIDGHISKILSEIVNSDKIEIFPRGDAHILPGCIYLSCPMASVKETEYHEIRIFASEIHKILKENCNAGKIYAPILEIAEKKDFDGPEKAALENFEMLKKAEVLLCIYPRAITSSILCEIGYAIALGKKVIIFTEKKSKDKLPYILQDGEKSFPHLKIYEYVQKEDVINKIKNNGKTFLR